MSEDGPASRKRRLSSYIAWSLRYTSLSGFLLSEGSGYALHSRLPHILWSADPPAAYVLDHL